MIVILAALAGLSETNAQELNASHVRILPTSLPGVIKLHYPIETNEPLDVTFLTTDGVVGTDRVTGSFPSGFSRRYDVRKIKDRDFWMLINSERMSVTYRIVRGKDKKKFTPFLEKSTYNNQPLVRANN